MQEKLINNSLSELISKNGYQQVYYNEECYRNDINSLKLNGFNVIEIDMSLEVEANSLYNQIFKCFNSEYKSNGLDGFRDYFSDADSIVLQQNKKNVIAFYNLDQFYIKNQEYFNKLISVLKETSKLWEKDGYCLITFFKLDNPEIFSIYS